MQIAFLTILFVGAAFAAFALVLAAIGGLQLTKKATGGVLQYVFYAIFLSNSVSIFESGRNLEDIWNTLDAESGGVAGASIRLASFLVLMACLDQTVRFFSKAPKIEPMRAIMFFVLLMAWVGNIVLTAFFGAHATDVNLSDTYVLFLGLGLLCLSPIAGEEVLAGIRNALILYILAGFLLIPIRPHLVLDAEYTQGYLPGVPRFAGLAPHAITLGLNAGVALWCLYAKPLLNRRLNRAAWCICGLALFLSQAKAVWIAFLIGMPTMWFFQNGIPQLSMKSIREIKISVAALWLAAGVFLIAGLFYSLSDGAATRMDRLLNSDEGAQLTSLTGRDRIWRLAMTEFRASPIFGYGRSIFGPEYRFEHHMEAATSGHSLYYDALSRSGMVGCVSMVLLLLTLVFLGFKFGKKTRGLSAALAISLLIRSVSEVPITLSAIGITDTPFYLLLAIIAIGFSPRKSAKKMRPEYSRFDAPTGIVRTTVAGAREAS